MLGSDRAGRASFAIVSIVLLMLASLSVAYLFSIEREKAKIAIQVQELEAMAELSRLVNKEVEVAAHYIAMAAIRNATQGLHDQSQINEVFSFMFSEFIQQSFPYETRDFSVEVAACSVYIITETRAVEDSIVAGIIGQENETEGFVDVLETGVPGGLERVERILNYRLIGHVNYTLTKGDTELSTSEELDGELDLPFPFIDQQARRFSLIGQGPMSEMAQILRYVLTMVAQQRVMIGFAGGDYGIPTKTTFDVLTAQDIEMAINLALILEQIKHFRSYDVESVHHFDSVYYPTVASEECLNNISMPVCTTLDNLLESYAREGTIDPADIYALFTAIDRDSLRTRVLLAQSMYAMTDQYLLKYMDYLGFLPAEAVANLMLKVVEDANNAWESLVEWITGSSKEAQMVRDYISELFNEMGYNTDVLAPIQLSIPAASYIVKNQSGATYNITIPARLHTVSYSSRSFLDGNNFLWESYYPTLFSNDLKDVHDGVRDLVANIASKIAYEIEDTGVFEPVSLAGHINPKDHESVLEFIQQSITTSIDSVLETLRNDPRAMERLVANLWNKEKRMIRGIIDFVETNYETFAPSEQCRMFAKDALSGSLMAAATIDPDYIHLDTAARNDLISQIKSVVNANGWSQAAYDIAKSNDFTRFETLYARATNMELPPENGGLYRKMVETIIGSTGILYLAGDFIKEFLQGLAWNDDVSDNKVLLPSYLGSFKLYEYTNSDLEDDAEAEELALRIDQTPDLLTISRLSRERGVNSDIPPLGELWVELIDPSGVPASTSSPNVHHTKLDAINERPYETQWTVILRGAVSVEVSTEEGFFLDQDGLIPIKEETIVPLDLELNVKVYSGWPLKDVAYACSNTFLTDVWDAIESFLKRAWDALASIVGWIVDGVKFVLRQVSQLIDYVQAMASKVLDAIYNGLAKVIDLLQAVVRGLIKIVFEAVGWILDFLPTLAFDLSAFGMNIHIGVNEPNCDPLVFMLALGSFNLRISFAEVDTEANNLSEEDPRFDILGEWHAELGPIVTSGDLDVLMLTNDHIIEGLVEWGDVWRIEIDMPVIEVYYEVTGHLATPPIPLGPIEIVFEIGFQVRFEEEPEGVNIFALIERSIDEAQRECGDLSLSLEWATRFTVVFIYRLVDNIVSEIERLLEDIIDATVYFSASFGVLGSFVDAGMRYSLMVEGEGLRGLFDWIVRNAGAILGLLANRASGLHLELPPLSVLQHIYVYIDLVATVGLPRFLTSFMVGPDPTQIGFALGMGFNLSIIGLIVGLDLGQPRVVFGARFEGIPSCLAGSEFTDLGNSLDLWAVRAILTPA